MRTNPREILLYYNPDSSRDRKTVAHAQSMSKHVRLFAHNQNRSTTTAWKVILNSLDLNAKQLLNKADPDYQQRLRGKEFDDEGWLHVLQHNPHLIKAPIAIKGNKALLVNSPTDIYRL